MLFSSVYGEKKKRNATEAFDRRRTCRALLLKWYEWLSQWAFNPVTIWKGKRLNTLTTRSAAMEKFCKVCIFFFFFLIPLGVLILHLIILLFISYLHILDRPLCNGKSDSNCALRWPLKDRLTHSGVVCSQIWHHKHSGPSYYIKDGHIPEIL